MVLTSDGELFRSAQRKVVGGKPDGKGNQKYEIDVLDVLGVTLRPGDPSVPSAPGRVPENATTPAICKNQYKMQAKIQDSGWRHFLEPSTGGRGRESGLTARVRVK